MVKISTKALRRFNAVMTVVWFVLIVPSVLIWRESVTWVVIMSVWANLAGHLSAWMGARAEDAAQGDAN